MHLCAHKKTAFLQKHMPVVMLHIHNLIANLRLPLSRNGIQYYPRSKALEHFNLS